MRPLFLAVAAVILSSPVPAPAQDGALDMGLITGDAAMSHLQQSEERRAQGMRSSAPPADRGSRARANCARKADFRTRFGADDPRVQQFYSLCRAAGY